MYKKYLDSGDIIKFNTDIQCMYNLRNNERLCGGIDVNVIVLKKLTRIEIPNCFNSSLVWYKVLYENEIYITPVRIKVKILKSK